MHVRPLTRDDADDALALYLVLTAGPKSVDVADFRAVLDHPNTWIFGAELDGHIRSMVTLHLLPNVTWSGRPYGVIENVVTDPSVRNRGLGRAVMEHAIAHARRHNGYKVMLMTGHRRGAQGFYEACGMRSGDKTAFQIRFE